MRKEKTYLRHSMARSAQAILLGLILVALQVLGMFLAYESTTRSSYRGTYDFYTTASAGQSSIIEASFATFPTSNLPNLMGTLSSNRVTIEDTSFTVGAVTLNNLTSNTITIFSLTDILGGTDTTAYVVYCATYEGAGEGVYALNLFQLDRVISANLPATFAGAAVITNSDRIVYATNGMTGSANNNSINKSTTSSQRFSYGGVSYIGGVNTILDGRYYLLTYADFSTSAATINALQLRILIIAIVLIVMSILVFIACIYITGGIGWRGVFNYKVVGDRLGRIIKTNKMFKRDFPDLYSLDVNMMAFNEKSRYAFSLKSGDIMYTLSGTIKRRSNGTAVLLADKLVVPYGVRLGTDRVEDAETVYYRFMQTGKEVLVGIIYFGNLNNLKTMFGQDFASSVRMELMKKIHSKMLHVFERDFYNVEILCESGNEMKHFLEDLPDIMDMLNQPIKIEQNIVNVGLKAGFAISDDKMEQRDFDYATTAANAAMKRAVEDKTVAYYVYHDSQKKLYSKYFFRLDITKMLEENVFELQYQPQYDIKQGKIGGFEALFRVRSGISVNANVFEIISYAERSGYMVLLGNFIFKTAMAFAKSIEGMGAAISINVSPVQLMQAGFTENFLSVYNQFDLKPGSICVEITESFLMTTFDETVRKLEILRKQGIMVHLDDFGTEYSSLLYLKTLPVDVIKIDKSFVDDICSDNYSRSITNLIITSSHELGLETIIEGVELAEQYNELKKMGGDIIQGYLISKAVKSEVARELIKSFTLPYGCDGSSALKPKKVIDSEIEEAAQAAPEEKTKQE